VKGEILEIPSGRFVVPVEGVWAGSFYHPARPNAPRSSGRGWGRGSRSPRWVSALSGWGL
jgi:hypothetical protein